MRLIDADALKEKISEDHFKTYGNAMKCIMLAPTVDAVPVVHGDWTIIDDEYNMETIYQCSVCKEDFVTIDGETPQENLWNYCPNCGAKMDGGNEE